MKWKTLKEVNGEGKVSILGDPDSTTFKGNIKEAIDKLSNEGWRLESYDGFSQNGQSVITALMSRPIENRAAI